MSSKSDRQSVSQQLGRVLQPTRLLTSGFQRLHKTAVLCCAVALKQFRACLTYGPTPKEGRSATIDCHFFRPYVAWTHAPSVHINSIALVASAASNVFSFCS